MTRCKCGCEESAHFKEAFTASESIYPAGDGTFVQQTIMKVRRGPCGHCIECLRFRPTDEKEKVTSNG
jgi:hypothetical protein